MRERLIELLKSNWGHVICSANIDLLANEILADGWIRPPCKVGDKLYAISDNRIAECTCDEINIHNEVSICAEFQCDYDCKGCPFNAWKQDFHTGEYSCDGEYGTWFFSLKDFGKTVFLTKEEAENALKGGNDVKCIDCEYLMFSDCYGECSKAYKGIVSPNDSCGKGVLKKARERE